MPNDVEISIIAIDAASNILQNIGSQFGILGQVAATSIGLAAGAMTELIKSGSEAQDTQAMFNAVLDNSPLKDYKEQLLQLAEAYSKKTRFEDDSIVSAETVLARYQNLGKDVMPQAVKTTLDLATLMKTDATTSAQQLGKALEDIAGGSLNLLGRTRLLEKAELEKAKAMAESGHTAEAQAYVLDLLDKKTGGLAEKMGQTYAGQMEIFNNTIQEIKESLGQELLPLFMPAISFAKDLADAFQVMGGSGNALQDVLVGLSNVFYRLRLDAIGDFLVQVSNIGDAFNTMKGSGSQLEDVLSGIGNVFYSFDNISPIFDDIGDSINFGVLPFLESMSLWWKVNGPAITNQAHILFDSVQKAVEQASAMLAPFVNKELAKFAQWFADNGPLIQQFAALLVDLFTNYILPAIVFALKISLMMLDQTITGFMGLATYIMKFYTDWSKFWKDVEKVASDTIKNITGFIDGLQKSISKMVGGIGGMGAFTQGHYAIPGRASGGSADGLTWVGERGPELVNLPSGSYVHSSAESTAMIKQAPSIVNVYFPSLITAASPYDIDRIIGPTIEQRIRKMQLEGRV